MQGCSCEPRNARDWQPPGTGTRKGPSQQTHLQRRHTDGQQAPENVLDIIHHQGSKIRTTVRQHLTPVRTGVIKKTRNHRCWRGCGERGALVHRWWGCKLVQAPWKTVWRVLRKLKIEKPCYQAISLLGIYLKELKPVSGRDTHTPCSLMHYSQQPRQETT